jgi:hypothetical protein
MKLTLKAGTGRRIVEFEILAIYWYKGKLLCAALKKERRTVNIEEYSCRQLIAILTSCVCI